MFYTVYLKTNFISVLYYFRDIFDDLVRLRIKSPIDFEWQKQARFYYIEDNDDCIVSITDVDFIYQVKDTECFGKIRFWKK